MSHENFQNCIDTCYECATECTHCETACLDEENVKEMLHCIKLDKDCAAICILAAQMMSRGSEFAQQICAVCAEICEACAIECEKHTHLDHCKKCAEVCRRCAAECRAMTEDHIAFP